MKSGLKRGWSCKFNYGSEDESKEEAIRRAGLENEQLKKVIAKNELDAIEDELMMLIEERHPERKEERIKQELYDAYLKNDKSVEEIIQLVENPEILEYLDWT